MDDEMKEQDIVRTFSKVPKFSKVYGAKCNAL